MLLLLLFSDCVFAHLLRNQLGILYCCGLATMVISCSSSSADSSPALHTHQGGGARPIMFMLVTAALRPLLDKAQGVHDGMCESVYTAACSVKMYLVED